jgi:hypothetical protein
MPTAAQIREVAYALPGADDLVVAEITHRAAVVSGLAAEQPRYYLQHALNFQVHDERHPHHPRLAQLRWQEPWTMVSNCTRP